MAAAFAASAEGGTCTIVGVPPAGTTIPVEHALLRRDRRLLGTTMGGARIHRDVPMLVDLYRAGRLKLDELVTSRLPLDRINEAVQALHAGEVARTVIVLDDD
jgi:Zn-dependent alcohol dehydrogenase